MLSTFVITMGLAQFGAILQAQTGIIIGALVNKYASRQARACNEADPHPICNKQAAELTHGETAKLVYPFSAVFHLGNLNVCA